MKKDELEKYKNILFSTLRIDEAIFASLFSPVRLQALRL